MEKRAYLRHGIINMSACPVCRAACDAWTGVCLGDEPDAATPEAGAFVICYRCGALLVFADHKGTLREPEAGEVEAIPAEHHDIIKALRRFALERLVRGRA